MSFRPGYKRLGKRFTKWGVDIYKIDGRVRAVDVFGSLVEEDVNAAHVIRSAIDYVESKGGGRVHILSGEYEINSTIEVKSNVILEGDGASTVLKRSSTMKTDLIRVAYDAQNVVIRDLSIDGNKDNAPSDNIAIVVHGSNTLVENVTIKDYRWRGIWIASDAKRVIVRNSRISGCTAEGIFISGGAEDVHIIENELFNNAIGIKCSSPVTRIVVRDNYIHDNNCGGMEIQGVGVLIEGNYVVNNDGAGILLRNSQHYVIRGNHVENNAGNGIDPSNSPDGVIAYNIVRYAGRDCSGTGEKRGITAVGTRTIVVGNIVEFCCEYGIGVWNESNVVVMGNICRNNGRAGVYKYGILIHASGGYVVRNVVVVGNRCFDDQDTKTQDYGIAWEGPGTVTHVLVAFNDVEGNAVAGTNFAPGQDKYVIDNWGFPSEVFKYTVTPTIGLNDEYGSPKNVYSPSNRIKFFRAKIVVNGVDTAAGETITVKIQVFHSDTTSSSLEKSFTSDGEYWLTDDDIYQLLKHGTHIRRISVYAKTNLSSTTATVTVNIYGHG